MTTSKNKFVSISKNEMDSFLRSNGFTPVSVPGTYELVYGKRINITSSFPATMRVYTTIAEGNAFGRNKGKDAIRVCLFYRDANGDVHMFGSDKRVNRIETWKTNLQKRIDKWVEMSDAPMCPRCNAPTVLRKGVYGEFYGCATWQTTRCSGKMNVD